MKSDEYWRKRAIRAEEYINCLGNATLSGDILPLYQKALENINERIRKIFKKFSSDGQLTADEAKELLTAQEDAEELKNIRNTLDDIQDPDLQRQARSRVNAPAYAARISREQAVGMAIQAEMAKVAGQQITAMEELLKPSYEYGKYRTIYDLAKGTGVGIDFTVMPVDAIHQALNEPWNGENFSQRVWDNTELLAEKAKEIVTSGIMSGESIASMSAKLDESMKQGKYNAVRLVRTEANHYYNDGRLQGYKDSDIEQYKFLASLDLRTCKKCGRLDGQKFDVDKAETGKNYPPLHPNDRCTTVAVILIDGKDVNDGERWSRNPETGKGEKVPSTMTWSQWYKEKVEGSEVAKLNKKKWDNRHADKKQHEKYRELLGKKVPKDFEKFQRIKYGNPDDDEESKLANAERWKKIKSEYHAKKRLDIDNKRINPNSTKVSHTGLDNGLTANKYRDTIDVNSKPITNAAINSVGTIAFNGLNLTQSLKVKQMCQSVLREAQQYSVGVECSETYSLNTFNRLSKNVGSFDSVSIPYQQEAYISVHNHPSGYTIGLDDLLNTATKPNERIIAVVGNTGNVYALQKESSFDGLSFAADIKSEMINTFGVDKVKSLRGKCTPEEMLNFVTDILNKGNKYGFRYYEKVH